MDEESAWQNKSSGRTKESNAPSAEYKEGQVAFNYLYYALLAIIACKDCKYWPVRITLNGEGESHVLYGGRMHQVTYLRNQTLVDYSPLK